MDEAGGSILALGAGTAIPLPSAALIVAAPARERREPCSGAKTKAIQCSTPLRFLG